MIMASVPQAGLTPFFVSGPRDMERIARTSVQAQGIKQMRKIARGSSILIVLAAFLGLGSPALLFRLETQEPKDEKKAVPQEQEKKPADKEPEDPKGKIPFWDTDAGQGIEASAQCFGAVPPPGLANP